MVTRLDHKVCTHLSWRQRAEMMQVSYFQTSKVCQTTCIYSTSSHHMHTVRRDIFSKIISHVLDKAGLHLKLLYNDINTVTNL